MSTANKFSDLLALYGQGYAKKIKDLIPNSDNIVNKPAKIAALSKIKQSFKFKK
jgi:hypothetical protein